MADGIVQVPPDSTGKKVDAASMDVGANTVYRQRVVIGDNSATAQFAIVTGGALNVTGTMNISAMPTVTVTGGVAISGTATTVTVITGFTDPSGTTRNVVDSANLALRVNVVGRVGSFTDNTTFSTGAAMVEMVGFIHFSASATSVTDGNLGAARITSSRGIHVNLRDGLGVEIGRGAMPLIVNIGTPFIVQGISTTVNVAVATPFTLQGISTTVTCVVAGFTPAIMSASHGPKCVTASTSANVTLIASPGAGASIYITMLAVSNAGSINTRARVGTSASATTIVMFCASAGGGFVMNFDPPWQLSASEAAICSVKPNTSDALFNVNFFVK